MISIKILTSHSNPIVKKAATLLKKRIRRNEGSFLLEGLNLIEAALRPSGMGLIKKVFYTEQLRDRSATRLNEVIALAGEQKAEIYEVPDSAISKLCEADTPQGIAAVASYTPPGLLDMPIKGPIVVCDAVSDPGNLGTVIRAADCAGASAVVVLEGSCDVFMSKTLRSSAGSIFNVPVLTASRDNIYDVLKGLGIKICVASPSAETSVFDTDLRPPVAMVFGNEAHGVNEALIEGADEVFSIPLIGDAESLNVAIATAVTLYESVRQRA